jgi:hypothetical protein
MPCPSKRSAEGKSQWATRDLSFTAIVKKYKSHRHIGGMVKILKAIKLQEQCKRAHMTF